MRLDHIAYRVKSINDAQNFFATFFGYTIADAFELEFDDGSTVCCYAMEPPEKISQWLSFTISPLTAGLDGEFVDYHLAPEIFVSEGEPGSIVEKWIQENGPGIHHLAYEVEDVAKTMKEWESNKNGAKFLSKEPLTCPGLIQVFTEPNPITGMIYELIQRTDKGFCKENVKGLMESTNG